MRRQRPGEDLEDEAVIAAMATGDQDAALLFVRRHQAKVYGVALAVVRDRDAADDVAQRAFERAWRHAAVFDARRGSAQAWLTSITRNLAIDAIRVRRPVPLDPAQLELTMTRLVESSETQAMSIAASDTLIRALRELPQEQARAVVMGALYGLPYAEVAEQEGIPVNTVKTRVRTAMRRLRQALEAEAERSALDGL